jgi:hypothetical protein
LPVSGAEPLTLVHDLGEFSCGKPTLDRWLKTCARSNQESARLARNAYLLISVQF